jgi:hypothetical protein
MICLFILFSIVKSQYNFNIHPRYEVCNYAKDTVECCNFQAQIKDHISHAFSKRKEKYGFSEYITRFGINLSICFKIRENNIENEVLVEFRNIDAFKFGTKTRGGNKICNCCLLKAIIAKNKGLASADDMILRQHINFMMLAFKEPYIPVIYSKNKIVLIGFESEVFLPVFNNDNIEYIPIVKVSKENKQLWVIPHCGKEDLRRSSLKAQICDSNLFFTTKTTDFIL